jgi:hypothetical protein
MWRISQGKCLFYEFAVGALQDLRNLLSLKRRLKKQEHGYRVRIRNHLVAKYFPEVAKILPVFCPSVITRKYFSLDRGIIGCPPFL